MRFLADESIDFAVIRALRSADHEVPIRRRGETWHLRRAGYSPRSWQGPAYRDRDFGRLVFASTHDVGSVIYLRYPMPARTAVAQDVVELTRVRGDELLGAFVVMQPGRIRIGRLPA